jgi:hypothetical protein
MGEPVSAHESPTDAALRAVAPLSEQIRSLPRFAHELPQGCAVRIGGDWMGFDGFDSASGLMHLTTGTAGCTHTPGDGERFEWSDLIGPA